MSQKILRHGMKKDWRDRIQIGDVLRSGSGALRVVRKASYDKHGYLSAVAFTIKGCSWTRRCYTMINRSDLKVTGYRATRQKYSLGTELDKQIHKAIHERTWNLRCCDVVGIS